MKSKMIFGFHAVTARLRHEASSVEEIYVDAGRHDGRMQDLLRAAKDAGVRIIQADDKRLDSIVYRIIRDRRESGRDTGDVLSIGVSPSKTPLFVDYVNVTMEFCATTSMGPATSTGFIPNSRSTSTPTSGTASAPRFSSRSRPSC